MKVLIIGNQFYDYQVAMQEVLKRKGNDVEFVSVDYNRSFFSKVSNKLFGRYFYNRKKLNELYKQINIGKYDRLFVIVGNTISKNFLKKIAQKKIYTILYLWDDIKRVPNYKINFKYYNKIVTFDKYDKKNYNLQYVPLFHRGCKYNESNKDIDLLFVGWLHSDRINILKKIYDDNKDLKIYFKVFMTPEQLKRNENLIPNDWILKKSISNEELFKLMGRSKGVIDINHPTQKGLTMRTIESLPYNLKIFTTNNEISTYDFYNPKMISIIDRNQPHIDRNILYNSEKYDKRIVDTYSIDNWVENVILANLEE